MYKKPTYEELEKKVEELERTTHELQMIQKALNESEKRYRHLYEKAPVMLHSIDSNGTLLMVSDYWLFVLGYERDEVIGRKSVEFLTNESREMAVNIYLPEFLRSGAANNVHYQMVKKNGGVIDVLLSATSEKDEKGEIIKSFAVIIDITEHMLAEQNLRIYENIVSSTPDGIAYLDENYRYAIVNDAYENFSGKKREHILGLTVEQYLGEEVFSKDVKPNFDECLGGNVVSFQQWFEYTNIGKRFVEITYFPYRDARSDIVGVVANTRDITEQKLAEEALRKSYHDLEIKTKIAELFITSPIDHIYKDLLTLLLHEFDGQYGYIGYINDNGEFEYSSSSKDVASLFHFPGNGAAVPKEDWRGIWGNSLANKCSVICNKTMNEAQENLPPGNYLVVPLVANKELVGQIAIANTTDEYFLRDQNRLELLADFIAPILKIFLDKEAAQNDLRSYARKLEEKNIAMNVLLENRDDEKTKISDSILNNFERLVFPYFEKLKNYQRKEDMLTIMGIIESNMLESLTQLNRSVSSKFRAFTPMEIQVADLIKVGKTSKQIAAMLNVSPRSVFFHRNNIREKLNIQKTKTNLRSFLLSLP